MSRPAQWTNVDEYSFEFYGYRNNRWVYVVDHTYNAAL